MTDPTRRSFLAGAASSAAVIAIDPSPLLSGAVPRLAAPVRVGVVGTGRQGRALLAELAKFEDVRVVALCDTDERRLQSALRRAPGAAGLAELGALLASDCDTVICATPTHRHREVVEAALAAGKHVYCEAPLAHTLEDARAIAQAARGSERVVQVGLQGRANPIYALARSFVRSGSIRDTLSMRAQTHEKTSWRSPASDPVRDKALNWRLDPEVSLGLAGEFGVHQFDVLHWFTGRYPERVSGAGAVLAWKDGRTVADTVDCRLVFPGGLTAGFAATLGNSYEGTYEQFAGTMGAVKLAWTAGWLFKEADAPTQGWEVYANRQRFHNDEGITLIADATKLAAQGKLKEGVGLPQPPLYYALEAFLKSVTEGEPVVCGAGEGLRATAVAIAAARAVTSGEDVAVELEGEAGNGAGDERKEGE